MDQFQEELLRQRSVGLRVRTSWGCLSLYCARYHDQN